MSKFWQQASSDEESEVSGSGSDEEIHKPTTTAGNRWDFDSESESEDEKRVVKSAKEKTWEAMKESIAKLRNAMKISDWNEIQNYFESLTREFDKPKTRATVAVEGNPGFYIRLLAELEDFLNDALKDKAAQKKMKSANSRALNRMKLTLKKYNKLFEEDITRFREHPEEFEVEEEEADESESDEEQSDDDDDSDEDSDKASEEEDEDDDSDEEDEEEEDGSDDSDGDSLFDKDDDSDSSSTESEEEGVSKRLRWVKKDVAQTSTKRDRRDKEPRVKPVKKTKPAEDSHAARYRVDESLTAEELDKRVAELTKIRAKRKDDSKKYLRQLEGLAKAAVAFGPRREIQVAMQVVRAKFDNQRIIYDYMDVESWRSCYRHLTRVVTLLEQNPALRLGALTIEDVVDKVSGVKLAETASDAAPTDSNNVPVVGTLASFTDRLKDEYVKSLQGTNPGTHEYERRRYDEGLLVKLGEKVQAYYLRTGDQRSAADAALLQVEHTYYMHDSHHALTRRTQRYLETWGEFTDLHPAANSNNCVAARKFDVRVTHPAAALGKPAVDTSDIDSIEPAKRLRELCSFIYAHGDERSKARALLSHVFYIAHHDQYHTARDMFFISHIQDTIDQADPVTQILYNRTLVQLGLCAFRLGNTQKAFDCLHPLYTKAITTHSPIKKLLAQGYSARFEKDPEQERTEKRRQVPNHMHLSLDLIESVYLTSTLFLELPYIARGSYHSNNQRFMKMLDRHLGRQRTTDMGDRVGMGPPENTQDHVIAGAAALLKGDWRRCKDYVLNLTSWNHLPGVGTVDRVKAALEENIKCEGMRTYLLRFGQHYESMSLEHLCEMFELQPNTVRRILSKMIFEKELTAAWDNPPDVLVFFKSEPSPLHDAAAYFTERFGMIVESNERLLDARAGGYGYKDEWTSRENRYRGDNRKQWIQQSRKTLYGKYSSNSRPQRRGPAQQQYKARRGSGGYNKETTRPHH